MIKLIAAAVIVLLLAGTGCKGPSTQEELCAGFDELSAELRQTNGIFDNSLFRSADRLGGIAKRFEGNAGVQQDGESLKKIGDSSSTSGMELQSASGNIAAACGKPPLAVNSLFGGFGD